VYYQASHSKRIRMHSLKIFDFEGKIFDLNLENVVF